MVEGVSKSDIPSIEAPENILQALIIIQERANMATQEEGKWDLTSGRLPRPELPPYLDLCSSIWNWICDINEIIENLNLVLGDLNVMSKSPCVVERLLRGRGRTRYLLLVRTFFYEFFRFKETFNNFLTILHRHGIIEAQEIKMLKSAIYSSLEHALKIRNIMVHDRYIWKGMEHRRLFVAEGAKVVGCTLIDKETRRELRINDLLAELCAMATDDLLKEGTSASAIFQQLAIEIGRLSISFREQDMDT